MGTKDDAGSRLRILRNEYLAYPAREPGTRTAAAAHGPAPMNLAMLDHITSSIREVTTHVRTDAPNAGAAPADPAGIYDWWINNTPDLDDEKRREQDRVIYRQSLEHAIRADDRDVICRHPCPGCGCWGLVWSPAQRRAACLNGDCVDEDGTGRTWELMHLAYEHVARQEKISKTRAT